MPRTRRPLFAVLCAVALATGVAACGGGGGGGGGGGDVGEPPVPPPPTQAEIDYAERVVELMNDERMAREIDPVVADVDAEEAAYGHAYDMDVRGFFDHVNPNGEDPGDRLRRAGAVFTGFGEVIAVGQETPEEVVAAWMASSGHRAIILNATYGRLGVGVRIAPGGPWWVTDFLAP